MEYIVSIRINLPETIGKIIKQEKDRFVKDYSSSYKSDPHITLYLSSYTEEGFPKLIQDLNSITTKSFSFSLKKATVIPEGLGHELYIIDVTNKEDLLKLHTEVLKLASAHRSPIIRQKDLDRLSKGFYSQAERENLEKYGHSRALSLFEPHITLGEIPMGTNKPNLEQVQNNLSTIEGVEIRVSSITVYFHLKEEETKPAKLIKEVTIPLKN